MSASNQPPDRSDDGFDLLHEERGKPFGPAHGSVVVRGNRMADAYLSSQIDLHVHVGGDRRMQVCKSDELCAIFQCIANGPFDAAGMLASGRRVTFTENDVRLLNFRNDNVEESVLVSDIEILESGEWAQAVNLGSVVRLQSLNACNEGAVISQLPKSPNVTFEISGASDDGEHEDVLFGRRGRSRGFDRTVVDHVVKCGSEVVDEVAELESPAFGREWVLDPQIKAEISSLVITFRDDRIWIESPVLADIIQKGLQVVFRPVDLRFDSRWRFSGSPHDLSSDHERRGARRAGDADRAQDPCAEAQERAEVVPLDGQRHGLTVLWKNPFPDAPEWGEENA